MKWDVDVSSTAVATVILEIFLQVAICTEEDGAAVVSYTKTSCLKFGALVTSPSDSVEPLLLRMTGTCGVRTMTRPCGKIIS